MKVCKMMGSINTIESLGLKDGPGIRCVVFFNGCHLRCKYCHNPEMWEMQDNNTTASELINRILRFKPYFKRNNGGVTFSGGEPLLQKEFLIEVCKRLKEENIHIALDTAGVGVGNYEEILQYVDLILYDVKHINKEGFIDITRVDTDEMFKFLEVARKMHKKFWIRQVIVPSIMDNDEYLDGLYDYLHKYFNIDDIERIDFLPYHTMGVHKYKELNIPYALDNIDDMDKEECNKLHEKFMKKWSK